MFKSAPTHFKCPNCDALYHLVKVVAGPQAHLDYKITCTVCAGALPACEGQLIFKYFLLRKATRRKKKQLRQLDVRT
jgi:hypothetical protein